MPATQFIHVETFARSAPKKARERRWTVREVVAEVIREPGAHPHVPNSAPPELVFGVSPSEVERQAMAAAEAALDPRGRKLRRDAQIIVAGVASFPVQIKQMSDTDRTVCAQWKADTVAWLRAQYGDRLSSVVQHWDESSPHLHWITVPDLARGERVESIHAGKAAFAKARAEGINEKRALDQRYRAAMRAWQDDYWRAVGTKHQLGRYGPRRRRLSRAEWQVEKRSAALVAAVVSEGDALRRENASLRQEAATLKAALGRVVDQARSFIRAILDPTPDVALGVMPDWLDTAEWERLLDRLRSFVSKSIFGLGKRSEPMAPLATRGSIGRER